MTIRKHNLGVLLATVLSTATLAVVPVYAQHGADDTAASGSGTKSVSAVEPVATDDSTTDDSGTTSGTDGIHDRAEKVLTIQRENHKEHSVAVRQKVCTNHKTEIDGKLTNLGSRAQKHLDTFNAIFTKVQAFHDSKQLTAQDYDSLVAAATAKQAAATTAVNDLKALSGTSIDCSSTDPASGLAAVKTAANDAKSALQAYRTSIKDVIKALQSENSAANKSGSN